MASAFKGNAYGRESGALFVLVARDRERSKLLLQQVDRLVARGDVSGGELWAGPPLLTPSNSWWAIGGRPWLTVVYKDAADVGEVVLHHRAAKGRGPVVCLDEGAATSLLLDVPGFARFVRQAQAQAQEKAQARAVGVGVGGGGGGGGPPVVPAAPLVPEWQCLLPAQAEWQRAKALATSREAFDLEIVVARYDEDVAWLCEEPFATLLRGDVAGCRARATVYDKGGAASAGPLAPGAFAGLPEGAVEVVPLANEGREAHSFLTHMFERHRGGLAAVTVFLTGSCMVADRGFYKRERALATLQRALVTRETVLMGQTSTDVRADMADFSIDRYLGSSAASRGDGRLDLCPIRPFGAWYDATFPELAPRTSAPQPPQPGVICWQNIFAVSRGTIERHPASRYERVLASLAGSSEPEAAHYVERAWGALFWPHYGPECVGRM